MICYQLLWSMLQFFLLLQGMDGHVTDPFPGMTVADLLLQGWRTPYYHEGWVHSIAVPARFRCTQPICWCGWSARWIRRPIMDTDIYQYTTSIVDHIGESTQRIHTQHRMQVFFSKIQHKFQWISLIKTYSRLLLSPHPPRKSRTCRPARLLAILQKTSSIFLRIATQYDTSKMNRNHVPIFFITVLVLNFIWTRRRKNSILLLLYKTHPRAIFKKPLPQPQP